MDPFIGEIKLWAVNRVPKNWALCDGAIMQIMQNQALYSLLGTSYGGNGTTTFALPDLRGRVPVYTPSYNVGAKGGTEAVTLTSATSPTHTHAVNVLDATGDKPGGLGNHIAAPVSQTDPTNKPSLYAPDSSSKIPLAAATVDTQGAGTGHNNMQPYLVLNYFICTSGLYPQRP